MPKLDVKDVQTLSGATICWCSLSNNYGGRGDLQYAVGILDTVDVRISINILDVIVPHTRKQITNI